MAQFPRQGCIQAAGAEMKLEEFLKWLLIN
jgi:hypothetical protein